MLALKTPILESSRVGKTRTRAWAFLGRRHCSLTTGVRQREFPPRCYDREVRKLSDTSTECWNHVADEWVAHADANDYRNHFLMPLTLRLLGDVSGKRILDLGCGEGGYARELARRAATVVGVDGSERLIEVARERAKSAHIDATFLCANASHMPELAEQSFEVVLAAMSLMDVEDYAGAIAESHRVLAPGGKLLMSMIHPCFMPPVWGWIKEEGRAKVFTVDRYFDRGSWPERLAEHFTHPVIRRHRTLEDYIQAPLQAGFTLAGFHEPSVSDEDLRKSPRFWKLKRIPYFLFMCWRKA